jgi:CxxC-x17-CxxC domain-containing protein
MKNFGRDDRRGNDRGGRFGSDRNDRDSRGFSMHQATCSECGKKCEVPFKPTGDRPIYCSTCFEQQGGGNSSSNRSGGGRSFDRPSFGDRQKFSATCDKCGKRCEVPFRPTGGKPIYCDDCFGKGSAPKGRGSDFSGSTSDLSAINSKLDRILKAMDLIAAAVATVEKKTPSAKKAVLEITEEIEEIVKPKKDKKVAVKVKEDKSSGKKSTDKKKKK